MPSWQVNNEKFLLNPITFLFQFQLIFLSFIFSEAKSNPITVLTNSQHVQPSKAIHPTQPTQSRHLNQLDKFVYSLVSKLQLRQHNIFVGLCVCSVHNYIKFPIIFFVNTIRTKCIINFLTNQTKG